MFKVCAIIVYIKITLSWPVSTERCLILKIASYLTGPFKDLGWNHYGHMSAVALPIIECQVKGHSAAKTYFTIFY